MSLISSEEIEKTSIVMKGQNNCIDKIYPSYIDTSNPKFIVIDDYYISSNIDTSSQIGVGLESAGNVFTGIAGSYVSVENDD